MLTQVTTLHGAPYVLGCSVVTCVSSPLSGWSEETLKVTSLLQPFCLKHVRNSCFMFSGFSSLVIISTLESIVQVLLQCLCKGSANHWTGSALCALIDRPSHSAEKRHYEIKRPLLKKTLWNKKAHCGKWHYEIKIDFVKNIFYFIKLGNYVKSHYLKKNENFNIFIMKYSIIIIQY